MTNKMTETKKEYFCFCANANMKTKENSFFSVFSAHVEPVPVGSTVSYEVMKLCTG